MAVSTHASAPALSRRHPPDAGTARGLLFTVLGEHVLPTGGAVWTSSAIDVLARLGVEEKAARQALTRVAAGGWLASERLGRRTRWHLTDRGTRLLTEGTDRIYGFAGQADRWDGRWLLVLTGAPEGDRSTRHLVRTRLAWAGLGSPRAGVWVSTHADRLDEVREVMGQAGVLADTQIFVATHEGGGELTAMVGQAWDLDAIATAYEGFLAAFEEEPAGEADPLARLTELVHAWRTFPRIDPALPRALLPAGWIGERAARVFAARHATWAGTAAAEWRRLETTTSPNPQEVR